MCPLSKSLQKLPFESVYTNQWPPDYKCFHKSEYFSALVFILSAQLWSEIPAQSTCHCTRHSQPVCGSDGITYSNPCVLRCTQASSLRPLTIVSQGPCQNQGDGGNCGCSLDYIPVCGSDGNTYPNACHVSCMSINNPSLSVAHEGECRRNNCSCPAVYQPVCGTNGVTYSNDCELNCETINDPSLGVAHYSAC